ncbi:hypothetical protein FSARC_9424 [Fusarium sarcochroum]|uniref:Cytochrome P450 n=1 Tax=Fusarium sarcochroum TaxID=1208366 RepID=A0A8H4TR03_9HYPO|nr:hypothetical protein FSARC_9424 [Fusarium sarcochroum]
MDIIDSQIIVTAVTAIAVHVFVSHIPEFPPEVYFLSYIFSNAVFFFYLSTGCTTFGVVFFSFLTANTTFLLSTVFLTTVHRLYFSPLTLHEKYQSDVIRVGPSELSVRNADAISKIYKGKHLRGDFNQVFNLVGGDTIATQVNILILLIRDKSLNGTEVPKYMQRVKGHIDNTVEILHKKAGEPVESGRLFDALVYDVLADLTFSKESRLQYGHGSEPTFVDYLHKFVRFGGVVGYMPVLQQLLRYLPTGADGHQVNILGHTMITERQAIVPLHKDFYAHFSSSNAFTQEELKLQSLTVLTAGADTVSKSLNQIFALLASRPDIQELIRQELKDAFNCEGFPSIEVLRSLNYLEGVIKEGLRMFPPLFRGSPAIVPKNGIMLETGDFIPPDTQVWIGQYLIMSDERNFPRAAEFLPERWMKDGNRQENELVTDRRAWFPFGHGAHSCPGKSLAMEEIRLIITYILSEFDVHFEEKGGQPFDYESWAADWNDFFAVEVGELYLNSVGAEVLGTLVRIGGYGLAQHSVAVVHWFVVRYAEIFGTQKDSAPEASRPEQSTA